MSDRLADCDQSSIVRTCITVRIPPTSNHRTGDTIRLEQVSGAVTTGWYLGTESAEELRDALSTAIRKLRSA